MPAVIMLDHLAELVLRHHPGFRLVAVAQTRFLQPVLPDQVVAVAASRPVTMESGAAGSVHRIAFTGEVGNTLVMKGSLDLGAAP